MKNSSNTSDKDEPLRSKTLWFVLLYVGGVVVVASISYALRLLVI